MGRGQLFLGACGQSTRETHLVLLVTSAQPGLIPDPGRTVSAAPWGAGAPHMARLSWESVGSGAARALGVVRLEKGFAQRRGPRLLLTQLRG